jgi:hypothetical protein
MKGWIVTLLAVLGGYVVIKHFLGRAQTATGLSGELSGTTVSNVNPVLGPTQTSGDVVAQQTGVGDFFVSPIASGVPVFNPAAIANGHGDQVAAAYHSNTLATLPGSMQYEPAFGPVTNQNPTNAIYIFG